MDVNAVPQSPPLHNLDPNIGTSRALQQVSTIATQKYVIAWMIENESLHGLQGLCARTVGAFPKHFQGQKSANLMRASRWWKLRDTFSNDAGEDPNSALSCSRSCLGIRKRLHTKATSGRGIKRSDWVLWLYPKILNAFEQFEKTGVKFSSSLLIELALSILLAQDSIYTMQSRDPKDDVLLTDKICHSWMQQFMDIHNIVLLSQEGRLTCSVEKERSIEMHTTYHLGVLQRGFQSGLLDENLIENIDETHFVVNINNSRTLGFRGNTSVKYAEVVSGGDSMTMIVRITGGRRAMIEAPILAFTNADSNYPIRGLNDDIPGLTYRTGPKGWMDQSLFLQYFEEPRAFQADVQQRTKMVWVDNCTSHNITARLGTVLAEKQTVLRYLPPCSTHLCQPADTFIISKIKDAWTKRWEAKKTELIGANAWQNTARVDGQWSGKLTNPGKRFFLQLVVDSVEDVNRQVDCNNMSYARKAMIRCGMALGVDGSWSLGQLFPHLQEIVAKYRPYFDGQDVAQYTRPI